MGFEFRKSMAAAGADCVTTGIAAEEIGRGDFNLTYAVMLNALIGEIINKHAREELKQEWLPKIASGDRIVGIAITEPSAGTDAGGIKTMAVRKGDAYVINGEKSGISVATEETVSRLLKPILSWGTVELAALSFLQIFQELM